MIKVNNEFDLKQVVYIRHDINQYPRYVTAITIRQTGLVYTVACGIGESEHYDFELCDTPDILLKQDFTGSSDD